MCSSDLLDAIVRGDAAQARSAYEKLLLDEPGFHPAHYNLGCLLLDTDAAAAIEHLSAATASPLPSLAANAFHNLALALYRRGRLDEAVAASARACDLEPQATDLVKTHRELTRVLLLRRDEARRKAAALEKEQATLKDRIAVEDKKLSDAEKAHADATRPLYARLHEIKAAISDASDARRNLIRTCPDAALKAELAAVMQRLIELRAQAAALRERAELVKQADREEEAARRMAEGIIPGTRTTRIDQMRERAARARKVGQEALVALPEVQKAIEKAEREEEAIYERMAKP